MVVFTSNIGSDTLPGGLGGEPADYERVVRTHYLREVREHFTRKLGRPELLNRLGENVLVFDLLRPQYIRGIADKFLRQLAANAADQKGLTVKFDPTVAEAVEGWMRADRAYMSMGGRQVRTLIEERVLKPLTRHVFESGPTAGRVVTVAPSADKQGVVIGSAS